MRETLGVVGAGVIGIGVAQTLAQTGHRVVLVDTSTRKLEHALIGIRRNLKLLAIFNRLLRDVSHEQILARIEPSLDYGRLAEVNYVIENTPEVWRIKQTVYRQLGEVCSRECIIAANTSTISIEKLGAASNRPDRVIGVHFMNPVPQMPVVEVIRGVQSSQATLEVTVELLKRMGKRAVIVKDQPGFVSNRLLMIAINEAILMVHEGVAAPETIDQVCTGCFCHKMGLLATADLIGLDTVLLSLEALHQGTQHEKYQPCPLLRRMVQEGRLGRKNGRGFYEYT